MGMAHALCIPGSNVAITVIFYIPAFAQKITLRSEDITVSVERKEVFMKVQDRIKEKKIMFSLAGKKERLVKIWQD